MMQRLSVCVQRAGGDDQYLPFETTEKMTPRVIQRLVGNELNIDPDCVSTPRPYLMPKTVGKEHQNRFSFKVVLKRAAAASTCPPSRLMETNGVWQRYFPDISHCWGCKAHMSEEEYKTKALPLLCGHTHCEQCATEIGGNDPATLNAVVCKYCLRLTLCSSVWSRQDMLGQGLDENPFGIWVFNLGQDHPEAKKALHRFVNQKAYEFGRQHVQIIKCFSFIRKTFMGSTSDTFVRLLLDYGRDQCVRVLQLRAEVVRLGLSPCEPDAPVRTSKSSRNGFPYLLIDAFHQVGALRKNDVRKLFWNCVPALPFKAMRRQLQSGSLEYLEILRKAGFFASATSATNTLNQHLWHFPMPQLELLQEWGADFNSVDRYGRTAAHSAARRGDADCLLVLCASGIDPTKTDEHGYAAAHYAAIHDHAECLEVLPETCLEERDAHGWTPAHHAASNDSVRAITCLLRQRFSIHRVATPQGDLPAHLATRHGLINVLNLFFGVSLSNENDGTTAIHIAAGGRLDCLTWLHDNGCQLDALVDDGTRRTALHIAAQRGESVCLEYLLRHANDARDTRTDDDKTAAHFAAESGNVACLTVLRQGNASMTLTDARGWKPLHYAAYNGRLVCLELLRDLQHSCADVEEALRIATARGLPMCAERLRSWVEALRHAASRTHLAPTLPLSIGRRSGTSSAASTSSSSSVRTHAYHLPTPRLGPTHHMAAGWVGSGNPVMDDFLQQLAVQLALGASTS